MIHRIISSRHFCDFVPITAQININDTILHHGNLLACFWRDTFNFDKLSLWLLLFTQFGTTSQGFSNDFSYSSLYYDYAEKNQITMEYSLIFQLNSCICIRPLVNQSNHAWELWLGLAFFLENILMSYQLNQWVVGLQYPIKNSIFDVLILETFHTVYYHNFYSYLKYYFLKESLELW